MLPLWPSNCLATRHCLQNGCCPKPTLKEAHRIIIVFEQHYARAFANRSPCGYSAPTATVTE